MHLIHLGRPLVDHGADVRSHPVGLGIGLMQRIVICAVWGWLVMSPIAAQSAEDTEQIETVQATAEQLDFFESKIRPLLIDHCYECHGEDSQESELRVDTLAGMLTGGLAGASLVPGKPTSSLLVTAVRYQDNDLKMPPDEKLSDVQIADVIRWVEMGAPHPDSNTVGPIVQRGEVDVQEGRKHWAFQLPVKAIPPAVGNASTDAPNPIDAFVLAELRANGLRPNPPADKRTLLRRVTFDVTGLPPTPEEVESFLADDSRDAFASVVDRLLASPHYGERWGRHWLDVARYADSNGLDENVVHGNAWRYRDYVVQSLNEDKPYNEFVVEQLAGDLLDSGDDVELRHERLIATGFLVLGPKVLAEQDEAKMEMDIIDEQIDTVGRSLLGLTLGCARCHTHKFDPISHHDYYGLAGIFQSTQTMDSYKTVAKWHENSIETPEQAAELTAHKERIAAREKLIADRVAAAKSDLDPPADTDAKPDEVEKQFPAEIQAELKTLREELTTWKEATPELPTAMGVVDGEIVDTAVHLRGSHLTLGDVVARRVPEVLALDDQPAIPVMQSGRLQFARWLTNGRHPLTARVMVNRLWRGHFGKGLVSTVDNFGLKGSPPTHPELLDWLAVRFVEEGWSIKAMHRMILLSQTYQRSSDFDASNAELDPGNQWYWRYSLRRLEAEAIRDGLLAVSGQLDRTTGGNIMQYKNREYVFNHTSQDKSKYDSTRRSIYVPVIRNHLYDMFQLFDYTDASVLTGDRNTSTIAPQALFLMNSEMVSDLTFALADRLLEDNTDSAQRVRRLYLEAYGRPPSDVEISDGLRFLSQFETLLHQNKSEPADGGLGWERSAWQAFCQAVVSSSEFVYVR
ncbi:PSD1 and planctomycete cytochrome C domain-containing protein [Rhodopirellula sp. P2]|uniref:PSD1 and planctomycete cytochrome C domain-containing protein n=1 Tax=Rhodopirellula sp. P2 TaxID=2127060 RepID=UPI002368C224|nr:PSD1 and planctomycete cytochrome C domain-containing protein [Rhodopirellula sp. P2]WDQ15526.1 PSD1 and planctomycete cytochrome C domain-containing protein [Rhodopirellula sp. P2]